jgi:hypothetical protein
MAKQDCVDGCSRATVVNINLFRGDHDTRTV